MSLASSSHRLSVVAVALLAASSSARAQFRVPPNAAYAPPLQTQGIVNPVGAPYQAPYGVPPPLIAPGYPYGYIQDPANGFLTGVAALTTATAQYQQQMQEAQLTQQEVTRSQMDTRRKVYDEYEYEQKKFRRMQDEKTARDEADKLKKARNNPSPTTIWSGDVLNTLMETIQGAGTNLGIRGAPVPLDPDSLRYINVTTGSTSYGSVGLFREGRPLRWPLGMQDDRFDMSRKTIEMLSAMAVSNLSNGQQADKIVRDLLAAIEVLKDQVARATNDMSPTDNVKAMRYLNQLREGARMMTDPNVSNLLTGKWAATGATVPEMLDNMARYGLKFAPAIDGDEPYYTGLYRAMLSCDASIQRLASARPPSR